ncbi:MAG: dethiobiotin synthase [Dysgonamonadaceae bacterium]|jgi:dethiobiotin synthetase|nr:dethiobiotin synthase [Dysgonamonadaceae bacterium]
MSQIYFVSGIDTNIGKSYVTGFLATKWTKEDKKVITQKPVQTGCVDVAEDIIHHRKMMGIDLLPEDKNGLTMPEIFTYPASPHLAAKIDKRAIDFEKIDKATKMLSENYDIVLIEGAGGLMVPLTEDFLIIDYIAQKQYPIILVTSGRLGSINHTLLSFEAIERRGLTLHSVVYNLYDENPDPIISNDTYEFIKKQMSIRFPEAELIMMETSEL